MIGKTEVSLTPMVGPMKSENGIGGAWNGAGSPGGSAARRDPRARARLGACEVRLARRRPKPRFASDPAATLPWFR